MTGLISELRIDRGHLFEARKLIQKAIAENIEKLQSQVETLSVNISEENEVAMAETNGKITSHSQIKK